MNDTQWRTIISAAAGVMAQEKAQDAAEQLGFLVVMANHSPEQQSELVLRISQLIADILAPYGFKLTMPLSEMAEGLLAHLQAAADLTLKDAIKMGDPGSLLDALMGAKADEDFPEILEEEDND